MSQVQLVVTGECERLALHSSLNQLFPSLTFPKPLLQQGFTSNPISDPPHAGVLSTAFKFAMRLVGAVAEQQDVLVIGIEDQEDELRPERQLEVVRLNLLKALDEFCLTSPPTHRELRHRVELAEQVATRCSFHLLTPMVEAYFFGDSAALQRAGAQSQSKFDAVGTDVEHFSVSDERFTAPPDTTEKHDWARGGVLRHRHPKRYLKFLSGDGTPGNYTYRESKHGAAALQTLNWPLVASNAHFVRSARALVADIADWAGVENPLPGDERELTSRHASLPERVLRNA